MTIHRLVSSQGIFYVSDTNGNERHDRGEMILFDQDGSGTISGTDSFVTAAAVEEALADIGVKKLHKYSLPALARYAQVYADYRFNVKQYDLISYGTMLDNLVVTGRELGFSYRELHKVLPSAEEIAESYRLCMALHTQELLKEINSSYPLQSSIDKVEKLQAFYADGMKFQIRAGLSAPIFTFDDVSRFYGRLSVAYTDAAESLREELSGIQVCVLSQSFSALGASAFRSDAFAAKSARINDYIDTLEMIWLLDILKMDPTGGMLAALVPTTFEKPMQDAIKSFIEHDDLESAILAWEIYATDEREKDLSYLEIGRDLQLHAVQAAIGALKAGRASQYETAWILLTDRLHALMPPGETQFARDRVEFYHTVLQADKTEAIDPKRVSLPDTDPKVLLSAAESEELISMVTQPQLKDHLRKIFPAQPPKSKPVRIFGPEL